MRTSSWKIFCRDLCIIAVAIFLTASLLTAQNDGGTLRGQVTDPSGAAVAGATVLLTTPSGASMDTTTNKDGIYEFKNLAPGKYQIKAVAQGFALFTKTDIAVTVNQVTRFNVPLEIEVQQEKVEVNSSTTQVDVNPANNANTIVMQGKDLEALSDDPDELQSELQALAGPSAGPNGGQIYIDGFTAGQLPPKASIREIRINQNPFSSEYDKLGYGRVEIFTKPGTDKLHGQFLVSGNTAAFNARNPFEILPEGTSPPGYNSEQYSGSIGGAINKKTSFFFNIDHRDIGALGIVSASVLCGDPLLPVVSCGPSQNKFAITPYSDAVSNPQTRTNLSPRIDYQLSPSNTLTGRYQYWRDSETNEDVGGFILSQSGFNNLETEHTLQLTDTQTISPTVINETRFQYIHDNVDTTPVNTGTNVNVGGAFNGIGYGGGNISDVQNRYEVQDIFYKTLSKHSIKFGGRLRSTLDTSSTSANFNGSFEFGTQSQFGCSPTAQAPCPSASPIQVYQITQEGLAAGLTIPQIQQQYGYGGANYYSQTAGIPATSVTYVDAGLYFQDDWKIRPNLTFSYGLRFETQNNFPDKSDFAPRLGLAWGIGGGAKKAPKTVLRAGFGIFYDRFTYNLLLTQERFNVNAPQQQRVLLLNPSFFLGDPSCVPPLHIPVPPACTSATGSTAQTIDYRANPNLRAPYTIQTGVTLERQLTRVANIAVTYLNSRGVHQFYTDNIDPIDPANPGTNPPNPVFQYQSEGIFKQNQLIVNGSVRMGAKLSLFGYYTLNYSNSDVGIPTAMPSIPGEPWKDYGRSSFDFRNRVFLGGTIGMPYAFRLSPFMIVSSGQPFNITTGSDPYGDSAYNVRPEFAPCTPTNQTKFGCFAIPSAAQFNTYTPIPAFYGEGPGRFALMLRLSKTFGFGPVIEGAEKAGPGGPSGGTFGRPSRGGGHGGWDAGATNHRYALTFAIAARNVFNNVNVSQPIGNLGSPLFGESNGLVGRPYSDPTSNRRLDLQVTFSF